MPVGTGKDTVPRESKGKQAVSEEISMPSLPKRVNGLML